MAFEKQKETTAARRQSAGKDRTPRTWCKDGWFSCTPEFREMGMFKVNGSPPAPTVELGLGLGQGRASIITFFPLWLHAEVCPPMPRPVLHDASDCESRRRLIWSTHACACFRGHSKWYVREGVHTVKSDALEDFGKMVRCQGTSPVRAWGPK